MGKKLGSNEILQLEKNIDKAISWKDYNMALRLADRLIELNPQDFTPYLTKKEICLLLSDIETARESLQIALDMAKSYWLENQAEVEYCLIEELEFELDLLFDEPTAEDRRNRRFIEYAYGLLFFIGAAPLSDLKMLVDDITFLDLKLNQKQFASLIEGDKRFKVQGNRPMIVSLAEIEDPKKLYRGFDERGLDYADFMIDDLVDSREVWAELYFDPQSLSALSKFRNLTGNRISVHQLHLMFNLEDSPVQLIKLIAENFPALPAQAKVEEIAGVIMTLWNDWPRWELGGNTPLEVRELQQPFLVSGDDESDDDDFWDAGDERDDEDDDWEDEPRQPIRVVKIGRNEPCPCGSGKKFKKCCGKNS